MLLVLSSPDFTPLRSQIAELAISYRLPTMFIFKTYVEAGGLLSYGADLVATHRQAATHVVKILKGTKVGDIAIEQPNRFELVVNLKTAKTIGIELPTSILLRADEVIDEAARVHHCLAARRGKGQITVGVIGYARF